MISRFLQRGALEIDFILVFLTMQIFLQSIEKLRYTDVDDLVDNRFSRLMLAVTN